MRKVTAVHVMPKEVPDVNHPGFAAEVRRQGELIKAADRDEGILDWLEVGRTDTWVEE